MIQLLSAKYNKHIAYVLLLFMMGGLVPSYGRVGKAAIPPFVKQRYITGIPNLPVPVNVPIPNEERSSSPLPAAPVNKTTSRRIATGGPGQPEMSSFHPAGAQDMVNLFTGDFSYNIPLLDVGGYPVNIFYDGSVSMEQEASWVGLGWNINPGNINRNMRGIPDDFNGKDTLISIQKMKPNKTWGVNLGADLEISGIKSLAGLACPFDRA